MWEQIAALRERGTTVILTTHYIQEAEEMADRVGIIRGGKILMVDDKSAIMQRMGTTEAVISLAGSLPELPAEIAGFPVGLSEDKRSIIYRGGDGSGSSDEEVAALTKALHNAGVDYRGIDIHDSSLEEIFVDLLAQEEAQ